MGDAGGRIYVIPYPLFDIFFITQHNHKNIGPACAIKKDKQYRLHNMRAAANTILQKLNKNH